MKLPKIDLLLSLVFPAVIFCAGIAYFVKQLPLSAFERDSAVIYWIVLGAIVLGGVLPAVLTLALNINTAEYLKTRLATTLLIGAADTIIDQRGANIIVAIAVSALCAAELFYQLLKVQDDWTTGGERAVLMLSDPIFYYSAFIVARLYI